MDITNSSFLAELYEQWRADPSSVPEEWSSYFKLNAEDDGTPAAHRSGAAGYDSGGGTTARNAGGPEASAAVKTAEQQSADTAPAAASEAQASAGAVSEADSQAAGRREAPSAARDTDAAPSAGKQGRVDSLLWAYRDVGYIHAELNPLGRYSTPDLYYRRFTIQGGYETLSLSEFGLHEEDLETEFSSGSYLGMGRAPLKNILGRMKELYCGSTGYEILHIQNKAIRRWLIEHIENPRYRVEWSNENKQDFQKDLITAESFEQFIQSNFIGQKRFSLEGAESVIPALRYVFSSASGFGIDEIVLGMAHRGRLNVLTNVLQKPAVETFAVFIDNYKPYDYGGSGDVKYHIGHSFDYETDGGRNIHVSLVSNPSHLESVDPVVEGKTRGIQRRRGDINRKKVMPILIHGDAAFSGQGVVPETLNLSQLKGYRTGGTVHIIINNQIGFTTASPDARSSFFCTDVVKSMPFPIIHVNGDDPEAVVGAVDLAMRFRRKFGYDAVIDIVGYRRLGHNEADEPSFTHPMMYSLIKDHPSAPEIYGRQLHDEGIFSKEAQNRYSEQFKAGLQEGLGKAKEGFVPEINDAYEEGEWKDYQSGYSFDVPGTAVTEEQLARISGVLTRVPEGFAVHSKLKRFIEARRKAFDSGEGIDWSFAEALSLGSILAEGHPVRMSGEDSQRGTFSQRHAVWWDVSSEIPKSYIPLAEFSGGDPPFSVYDSPLSEFSVLGFEYGYSLARPSSLVIWEAQFGDFVNGAQVVIDQYISSGEAKWFRSSGLVMLLPHGFEGQGPEHSNAYLERFLQLCADNNLQVCNLSTPSQYFHVLRKQVKQPFRKPLIIMSPKSLLRHKTAVSKLSELSDGGFRMVLDDPLFQNSRQEKQPAEKKSAATACSTLCFCSGKVYYDLIAEREERDRDDCAVIRIEQLYPFPEKELTEVLSAYDARRLIWVQEEPRNRGAWTFIKDRLARIAGTRLTYAGRPSAPAPASGSHKQHEEERRRILDSVFSEGRKKKA